VLHASPRLGDAITIQGHLARTNPQWRSLTTQSALAVFTGPHAYVSPSLYDRRESVPTWNYLAVHAYGTVRLVEGVAAVTGMLDALIARHESSYLA
jgi:transcriptional regulator